MGYDYFPLQAGDYRIFEVADIRYTIQDGKDSSFYYLKEVVMDSSIDQMGETTYFIYQYKRLNPADPWEKEPVAVNMVKRSVTNLVVYEGNTPYVKLTFPVKSGLTWDGNAYNTRNATYYRYSDVETPETFMNRIDAPLIRVVQNDFDDQLIRRDQRNEIYVAGIGLVYKESSILEYCQESECFGQKEINSGTEFRQTLIEYGKQ